MYAATIGIGCHRYYTAKCPVCIVCMSSVFLSKSMNRTKTGLLQTCMWHSQLPQQVGSEVGEVSTLSSILVL